MTKWNRRNIYSEVAVVEVTRKPGMFAGDSTVTKTNKALNKGHDVVVSFPWAKI